MKDHILNSVISPENTPEKPPRPLLLERMLTFDP